MGICCLMSRWCCSALLLLALVASVVAGDTVRVAAIQCPSQMGQVEYNRKHLTTLVRQAAAAGAKIVVMPECAVSGYLDPVSWISWTPGETDQTTRSLKGVAEPVPGPTTEHFAALAKELAIYLCVTLAEVSQDKYYNVQVLLGPQGTIVAHHRKKNLWTPGDGTWCAVGDRPVQVVATEYGRLGLMICYDVHLLPPELAKAKADIVLYSVGWYGPHEKEWFSTQLPERTAIAHGYHVIAANWSARSERVVWPGRGYSAIIARGGQVLKMATTVSGDELVIADLPR